MRKVMDVKLVKFYQINGRKEIKFWVYPNWEPTLFRYYLDVKMYDFRLSSSIKGIDISNVVNLDKSGKIYLITDADFLTHDLKKQLINLGFSEYPVSLSEFPPHQLWLFE